MNVGELFGSVGLDTTEFDKGINQVESSLTETGGRFEGLGSTFNATLGGMGTMIGATLGVGLIGAAGMGFGAIVSGSEQSNQAVLDLQANLGLTEAEAENLGDVANRVFAGNWGDSIADASESVGILRKSLGEMPDDELQAVTEGALTLRDTFGIEVAESAMTIKTLMEDFGLTSEEALDFVTKGFQSGLNSSDDFLDTINEYGPLFSQSGTDASQFFSILDSGMQSGVLGTDKVADAFKESRIRLTEYSEAVASGMQEIGNSTFEASHGMSSALAGPADTMKWLEGIAADNGLQIGDNLRLGVESGALDAGDAYSSLFYEAIKDGSIDIHDVQMQTIKDLANVDDQIYQNTAGVAIFGTMWEDMGAEAMLAINDTGTSMDDLVGSTDSMMVKYTSMGSMWEGFKRQALVAFMPIGDKILEFANVIFPHFMAGLQTVIDFILMISTPIGDFIAYLSNLATAFFSSSSAATDSGSVMEELFGGSLTKIMALVSGILPQIMGLFQSVFGGIKSFIEENQNTINSIISGVWSLIKGIFEVVMAAITNIIIPAFTAMLGFITSNVDTILSVLTSGWQMIMGVIDGALKIINGIINTVMGILTGDWSRAWEGIKGILSGAWGIITSIITNALEMIGGIIRLAWEAIKGIFSFAWEGIKTIITAGLDTIIDWLVSAWDTVKTNASEGWQKVKDTISEKMEDAKNGVSIVIQAIKDIIVGAKETISNAVSTAFGGVTNIIKNAFSNAIAGVKGSINVIIDGINALIDGMNIVNPLEDIPHVPRLAMGTERFKGGLAMVGESGPELVSLPNGSNIYPNSSLAGLGGNTTYELNVYTSQSLGSIRSEFEYMKAVS